MSPSNTPLAFSENLRIKNNSMIPKNDHTGIHLSIVATSRNDDHGGNLLYRTQSFVDGLIAQCRRHDVRAELILIDWNPPPDRPPLAEALDWPDDPGPCRVRVVVVPAETHSRLAQADKLPLFQMIAKNVGIRRARGQYVVATNIDILLNDRLMRYLKHRLRPGRLYRVDRYDVPSELPGGTSFEDVLEWCDREAFRIHRRRQTFIRENGRWVAGEPSLAVRLWTRAWRAASAKLNSAIRRVSNLLRFLQALPARGSRACARWLRRLRPVASSVDFIFGGIYLARHLGLRGSIKQFSRFILRLCRGLLRALGRTGNGAVAFMKRLGLNLLPRLCLTSLDYLLGKTKKLRVGIRHFGEALDMLRLRLHTNACGDFTLLSREDWFRLRGYPEWEIFSWHLDSVLLYQANRNGIKEVDLGPEMRIYHIEHGAGSGYTPEGADLLFERLRQRGIPFLEYEDFKDIVSEMRKNTEEGGTVIFNALSWGMGERDLPELNVYDRSAADKTAAGE